MSWEDKNLVQPSEALSTVSRFVSLVDEIFYWGMDRNITKEGGATSFSQLEKLKEEVLELQEALEKGDREDIEKELGDVQVVVLNICRLGGFNLTECLDKTYAKIKDRKGQMVDGKFVKEQDLGV